MSRVSKALGLVLVASFLIGSCVFSSGGLRVDAIFSDIGDLPRFANVQVADVVVGTVRGIRLDGYKARVTMRIDPTARIPRNARALIRSTSLLGEKFIELKPPTDEAASPQRLRDGDVIPVERTERVPGVDDAFVQLGRLLEGGTAEDLAIVINSSAEILRGKEGALGQIFQALRGYSDIFAGRAPDVAAAIDQLDAAFATLAGGADAFTNAISSASDTTAILAEQHSDLERLVSSLDRASSVLGRYASTTRAASDAALKDLRAVLDEVMKATGDLEQALTALARFTDLWPRSIPGDYIQLDVVVSLGNVGPSGANASGVSASSKQLAPANGPQTLAEFLWRPVR